MGKRHCCRSPHQNCLHDNNILYLFTVNKCFSIILSQYGCHILFIYYFRLFMYCVLWLTENKNRIFHVLHLHCIFATVFIICHSICIHLFVMLGNVRVRQLHYSYVLSQPSRLLLPSPPVCHSHFKLWILTLNNK